MNLPVGPSSAELVAELVGTLDAMVDQPLVGAALFGEADRPAVGRYLIERRLGAGATAIVYAARDTTLDRAVALKIVVGRDVDGVWYDRIRREARALARLTHPNVVAVYDADVWRGHPFIAMERVAGVTLQRWQEAAPRTWPAVLRHYLAAGRGLEAAHAAGLVHRDFKPANVLVADDSGRTVVTDFGLAAPAEPGAARSAGGGRANGTPAYLAPEQRAGAPPQPSADVYSFSVALCEALAGRHPLIPPVADWRRALERLGISARARAAIERGMAADPAQRWPRMGPLLAELEAALPAPARPRRLAAGAALALGLGLAAGLWRGTAGGGAAAPASAADDRDPSLLVAVARGQVADEPPAAAALLREVPPAHRGEDWSDAARAVLLRPLAREVRCLEERPRTPPSTAHGVVAAVDVNGRAVACEVAAERAVPLATAHGAVCARVLDADRIAVLTEADELVVFERRAGWRPGPRTQLPPANATAAIGSRCETDPAIAGPRPPRPPWAAALDPSSIAAVVAPDGGTAVTGNMRGELTWSLSGPRTGAPALRREIVSERQIDQLAFNPSGTWLAWRDRSGGAGVRDARGTTALEPPFGGRSICQLAFASDERLTAVTCGDGRVLDWDLAAERTAVIGRHELAHCARDERPCPPAAAAIWSMAVDEAATTVATGGSDSTVGIWPISWPHSPDLSGPPSARLSIAPAQRAFTLQLSGDLLLVAARGTEAQLWSWRAGTRLAALPGHEQWAYATAAAGPAGDTLVTGSRSGTLRFWSRTGALLDTAPADGHGAVNDLATSADGRLVAAARADGDLVVAEARTGAVLLRLKVHERWARRVAFLDADTLISAGDDGLVQRISLSARRITDTLHAHGGPIYDLDLRGHSLLTASHDGTVRLWDLRTSDLVRTFVGHKRPVLTVRWSADGTRFVSGAGDTREGGGADHACVWRVDRDTCHAWLIGHRDDLRAARFLPDGRVLTSSFDGTVRVWVPPSDASPDALAAELSRRSAACLDAHQRATFLGEPWPVASARACRRPAP